MIFKLKCKNCGNVLTYDTNEKSDSFHKCNNCDNTVEMNIEAKLSNVAEMEGFELLGIQRNFSSKVLCNDLNDLEKIFDSSDEKRQKIIVNIIDKIYLMLNRNDSETDIEIEKTLNQIFYDSCDKGITL